MNPVTTILSYLLFYLLLLFSLLPMKLLYVLSDILAFLLFHVLGYRKKAVMRNLGNSLPAHVDRDKVARRFYRFLGDVVMESVKCLTIRRRNLMKMIHCDNPAIMNAYAVQNRSVIYMSGHYCNWEVLIHAMNLLHPHLAVGVGKPLTNKTLNRLINARRSRTGMKIINAANIKEEFEKDKNTLTASLFLSDQYPGGINKGFPSVFLNKDTEFMYGAEKYARTYNYPVIYAELSRHKRGRYRLHLTEITSDPAVTPQGEIMTTYIRLLEQTIQHAPEYWLWSHKRWKHLPGFYD
jgi:Kdo2-lipid IVA lauroyltransferase/acyltransferase